MTDGSRHAQMYPTLGPERLREARRFASGEPRRFAPGEAAFETGARDVPVWLVTEGSLEIVAHDGLGQARPITTVRPGNFTGEVAQLSGGAVLADARAGDEGAVAIPFDAAHLRALVIGSVEIGETVMRALILRRVGLVEGEAAGAILVGRPDTPALARLETLLVRNGYPFRTLSTASDGEGRDLMRQFGVAEEELPLLLCPNGTLLRRPEEADAGVCLGLLPDLDASRLWDTIIVGAGPAGLATAVYAASEGLSVLVIDAHFFGGQAGASARIENYLGFPTGISGHALAARAFIQAQKFGAVIAIPVAARQLHHDDGSGTLTITLSNDACVRGRSVVIASGADYRRPDVANLADFEGAGISYWASPVEAQLCKGERIALVGGGNSAGQAVAFLAPQVEHVHLHVRHPLDRTMSRYLIERIDALENVSLHVGSELAALEGDADGGLSRATFRCDDGDDIAVDVRHLFLFIGALPCTDWLSDCVARDDKGFVRTGADAAGSLATSRPGVFAIGDVRAGSTKRVAAAVGEGAAVVAQLHQYLSGEPATAA